MAIIDLTTLTVPTPVDYNLDYPTRNQENLANVNLQIWDKAREEGYILDDGQIPVNEFSIWETLWNAQNDIIDNQSAYVNDVKELFNSKQQEIPEDSILDELINELKELFIEWSIAKILILLGIASGLWTTIIAIGVRISVGYLFKELKKLLTESQANLSAIKSENDALKELPITRENYKIRSQVITQHDITIGNLIAHASALEARIQNITVDNNPEKTETTTPKSTIDIGYMKAIFDGPITSLSD